MMNIREMLSERLIVAGHRGFCAKYPENTMASFSAAAALKVDMLELDIALSKDQVPVLLHDRTLGRTSNGSGNVSDYTIKELKRLDFGSWLSPQFAGEKIPTLEEFCLWAQPFSNLCLNIDLKKGDDALASIPSVIAVLERFGLLSRAVFNSADGRIVRQIYALGLPAEGAPNGRYGMIHFDASPQDTYRQLFSICLNIGDVSPEAVEFFRAFGLRVWCWGTDTLEAVAFAAACGIELMVCNDPTSRP